MPKQVGGKYFYRPLSGLGTALSLLPGAPWRMTVVMVLGLASTLVEATAIGMVLLLLKSVLGGETPVSGFGLFGWLETHVNNVVARGPVAVATLVVAVVAVKSLLATAGGTLASYLQLDAYQSFRERLFSRALNTEYGAAPAARTGDLINLIENISWAAADCLFRYAGLGVAVVMSAVYAVILGTTSWPLTLIAVAIAALAGLALVWTQRHLFRLGELTLTQKNDLTRHLVAHLTALRTIKIYRGEARAIARSFDLSRQLRRTFWRSLGWGALTKPLLDATGLAIIGAVAFAGMQLNYPPLILVGFATLLYKAQANLFGVHQALTGLAGLQPSLQAVAARLAEPAPPEQGLTCDSAAGDITFNEVSFSYANASQPALVDASIEFVGGGTTVIMGRSGAGKSTLLSLLLRLMAPESGVIRCHDQPIGDYSLASWRARVVAAGQDVQLVDGSLRDNLTLAAPDASDADLRQALALAGGSDILNLQGGRLDFEVGEHGGHLSGGQRQRICLARALLARPDVLLLDEAANAVDAAAEIEIYRNIRRAYPELTLIITAHRNAVAELADQLVALDNGRVIYAGPPAQAPAPFRPIPTAAPAAISVVH